MGLSQRRVDETAWTHEQPHRGTAATPLATAILNLRHGQGAVARRLRLIDSRLGGIVAAIVGLAETKRANEEEKERRRRTYEEARALYESQVRARDDDKLTPVTKRWLEWAKAKADWLDPLVRRSDPILDAPEPEAPSYWRF